MSGPLSAIDDRFGAPAARPLGLSDSKGAARAPRGSRGAMSLLTKDQPLVPTKYTPNHALTSRALPLFDYSYLCTTTLRMAVSCRLSAVGLWTK